MQSAVEPHSSAASESTGERQEREGFNAAPCRAVLRRSPSRCSSCTPSCTHHRWPLSAARGRKGWDQVRENPHLLMGVWAQRPRQRCARGPSASACLPPTRLRERPVHRSRNRDAGTEGTEGTCPCRCACLPSAASWRARCRPPPPAAPCSAGTRPCAGCAARRAASGERGWAGLGEHERCIM